MAATTRCRRSPPGEQAVCGTGGLPASGIEKRFSGEGSRDCLQSGCANGEQEEALGAPSRQEFAARPKVSARPGPRRGFRVSPRVRLRRWRADSTNKLSAPSSFGDSVWHRRPASRRTGLPAGRAEVFQILFDSTVGRGLPRAPGAGYAGQATDIFSAWAKAHPTFFPRGLKPTLHFSRVG